MEGDIMSGKKSRSKGARFEREIAAFFQEWSGLEFRRTPLSGGWSRQNPNVAGDLVCIDEGVTLPFIIECKNQESWTWEALLIGGSAVFAGFWEQTVEEALIAGGRIPLLVFTKNYDQDWIATPERIIGELNNDIRPDIRIEVGEDRVFISTLDAFHDVFHGWDHFMNVYRR